MSLSFLGRYAGLQALIKNQQPNAEFVHCAAHNLNLVVNDSVKNILEISKFYDIVEELYVFFSDSLLRWNALNSEIRENKVVVLTLKRLCPTRWSSRLDALFSIKTNFTCILKCLTNIVLISKKSNEKVKAMALKNKTECFDFILMLEFQFEVMQKVQLLSKLMQSSDVDLETVSLKLKQVKTDFIDLRKHFNEVVSNAKVLAQEWKIDTTLKSHRQNVAKRFFDEIASDTVFSSELQKFKITVFYASLDIIIAQISNRFTSFENTVQPFMFLNPIYLSNVTKEDLTENCAKLVNKYENDLSFDLENEIKQFQSLFSNDIKKLASIWELCEFIFNKNCLLCSNLPNLCTALQLFITMPVTSASAERSFSKLKLIKTFLRNTIGESRLSNLAIIGIEAQKARNLNIENLVDTFIKTKKRRFCLK